jgi:hypothetical protein
MEDSGVVTLRYHGRLHHTGIGRTHVLLLVHDRDIRVINVATGKLLRALTLDPTRDYQPQTTRQTHIGPNVNLRHLDPQNFALAATWEKMRS